MYKLHYIYRKFQIHACHNAIQGKESGPKYKAILIQ